MVAQKRKRNKEDDIEVEENGKKFSKKSKSKETDDSVLEGNNHYIQDHCQLDRQHEFRAKQLLIIIIIIVNNETI
jgi:hypothetical protein